MSYNLSAMHEKSISQEIKHWISVYRNCKAQMRYAEKQLKEISKKYRITITIKDD